ncbi:lpha-mannosyltransferase [Diaporthe amygdali]|uniref:lpha-mannosyltransferase n=1 Tax=Phomopsis amygdali TaxID=1214568 RepID=UPI0022FE9BE2|nr:lpha-mannosyltransferase [Diaporthe amygdali]KAJ0123197.1 lpha-mannosyltransferase [Diaporthe amygdali]
MGALFSPPDSPLKEGRILLPLSGNSRSALKTRRILLMIWLFLIIAFIYEYYPYSQDQELILPPQNVAPSVQENAAPEGVVPTEESLTDDVDGPHPDIPFDPPGQTPLTGQDHQGHRNGLKRPGGGSARKTHEVVPTKDFDEAFRRIINLLPGELEIRGLLQPLDSMTGEARLRELGVRTRNYKKYLEAWEDLHLVPDSEGGTYIRDDVLQYIHDQHRISNNEEDGYNDLAETVHAYESYRQLLVRLSELLFPFTAPYFPDHMTLRSHIQKGGRGIALTAGNDQVAYLLTQIPILRRLGCDLPIEVMYASDADLNRDSRQDLEDLEGVVTRDIGAMVRDQGWTLAGWAIKPFAILLSSFREVIFIDSDSFFFRNPEVMFDDPGYVKTGALFFRDRLIMPELRRRWLQSILPQPVSRNVKQSRLWSGDSGHQQESGVLVVDTYRHFMAMLLVTRMNGPDRDGNRDDHKVGVYDMVYGDKETFWLGFELVGDTDYVFHQGDTGTLGVMKPSEEEDKPDLSQWAAPENMTDPEAENELDPSAAVPSAVPQPSRKMCAPQLLHLDLDGKPFWFNGGLVMNKFLDRRQWKFGTFESYLIEPHDIREPGAWILGDGNMCCLTTDHHLYGILTPAEKDLLEEMITVARKNGIAR